MIVLIVGLGVHDLLDLRNVLIKLHSDCIDLFLALLGDLLRVSLVFCLLLGLLTTTLVGRLIAFCHNGVPLRVLFHLNLEDSFVFAQLRHVGIRPESRLNDVKAMSIKNALALLFQVDLERSELLFIRTW